MVYENVGQRLPFVLRHELMLAYLPVNLAEVPELAIDLVTPPAAIGRHSADPAAQLSAWRQWSASTLRPPK